MKTTALLATSETKPTLKSGKITLHPAPTAAPQAPSRQARRTPKATSGGTSTTTPPCDGWSVQTFLTTSLAEANDNAVQHKSLPPLRPSLRSRQSCNGCWSSCRGCWGIVKYLRTRKVEYYEDHDFVWEFCCRDRCRILRFYRGFKLSDCIRANRMHVKLTHNMQLQSTDDTTGGDVGSRLPCSGSPLSNARPAHLPREDGRRILRDHHATCRLPMAKSSQCRPPKHVDDYSLGKCGR